MKAQLTEKIMKEFVGLRAKTVLVKMMVMKVKKQKAQKVCHKKKT